MPSRTDDEKKQICVGLLAHVDAGKTTLAECLLYLAGSIRKAGRVDHGDAFLDTDVLEKARGITIFAKQAVLTRGNLQVTLLDTPGHEDFSAEAERTLAVLDYAVLIISGADGVRAHDEALWELLKHYGIPVFIFVNKMDQPGTDREQLMGQLLEKLSRQCIDFSGDFMEAAAVCDEELLEAYLARETLTQAQLARAIAGRSLFPCFFGAALRGEGVEALLDALCTYMQAPVYPRDFGARVYKISRDEKGTRLTHLKVTGGVLRVKQVLRTYAAGAAAGTGAASSIQAQPQSAAAAAAGKVSAGTACGQKADVPVGQDSLAGDDVRASVCPDDGTVYDEKADQLRIYSGAGCRLVQEVAVGGICAVTGPLHTYAGEGLGSCTGMTKLLQEPVLHYHPTAAEPAQPRQLYEALRQLEEEMPELHVSRPEPGRVLSVQVMGEVQIEILKSILKNRYGMDVTFDTGDIVYKETIAAPVEGVGHFEPLHHYAEVHLLLEPLPAGSGLSYAADCPPDSLDQNWQRLVLTHLAETQHPGVLTGSAITDMRITLKAGRAHIRHTQGGDFREATYRAVRQGLKSAQSILLEPQYTYVLELPAKSLGRAIHDIQTMGGSFEQPRTDGERTVITGTAPVAAMRAYPAEVTAYTAGQGRLYLQVSGYAPCANEAPVIAAAGYDSEADTARPTGSVFCAHGGGFFVPWDEVPSYMHLPSCLPKPQEEPRQEDRAAFAKQRRQEEPRVSFYDDQELTAIFERTYGPIRRERGMIGRPRQAAARAGGPQAESSPGGRGEPKGGHRGSGPQAKARSRDSLPDRQEFLLVDGYNMIFSWADLKELSDQHMDSARMKLADLLCDYQGYKKNTVILVFDAYKVAGGRGETIRYKNIYLIYTKEAETADQYIEKAVHDIGRRHHVTVATSDGTEQVIILGQGAVRMSARELLEDMIETRRQGRAASRAQEERSGQYLLEGVSDEMSELMEDVRLGYRTLQGPPEKKRTKGSKKT